MRNIVNLSMPDTMVKIIKKEVKAGGFASTSEFFRHLLRLWNTHKLAEELKGNKVRFEKGEGKELPFLKRLK